MWCHWLRSISKLVKGPIMRTKFAGSFQEKNLEWAIWHDNGKRTSESEKDDRLCRGPGSGLSGPAWDRELCSLMVVNLTQSIIRFEVLSMTKTLLTWSVAYPRKVILTSSQTPNRLHTQPWKQREQEKESYDSYCFVSWRCRKGYDHGGWHTYTGMAIIRPWASELLGFFSDSVLQVSWTTQWSEIPRICRLQDVYCHFYL